MANRNAEPRKSQTIMEKYEPKKRPQTTGKLIKRERVTFMNSALENN